ncbi:MAG: CAP domain-containing protein [Bacteroidales bacterium]
MRKQKIPPAGILLLLLTSFSQGIVAQQWSSEQLKSANTTAAISYLSQVEKEAILYINLARLYPQQFRKIEIEGYYGPEKYGDYLKESDYLKSLIHQLDTMKAVGVLVFAEALYENAKCFAAESGDAGIVGHTRIKCPKGNYAECCSYGMETGKDIALQWLIDHDVPSLGHRVNCLNPSYTKIGLSVHTHKQYGMCAVADLIW